MKNGIPFLSLNGLSYFLNEIKKIFAPISHSHKTTDITDITESFLYKYYPVGCIYMSTSNINPNSIFGFGTWTQIKDKFLLAAGDNYVAGSTGGEVNHALSANEMPSHSHSASVSDNGAHTHQIGTDKDTFYSTSGQCWSVHNSSSGAAYMNGTTSSAGRHSHTVTIGNTGEGQAHNNMPPYLTVYIWERVA